MADFYASFVTNEFMKRFPRRVETVAVTSCVQTEARITAGARMVRPSKVVPMRPKLLGTSLA